MATTGFASPWPPSALRPGPAWIWAPPRPFPASVWLAQRSPRPTHAGRGAGGTSNKPASLPVPPTSSPARPVGPSPKTPSPEALANETRRQDAGATHAAQAPLPGQPRSLAAKLADLLGIPPLPPPPETSRLEAGATSGAGILPARPGGAPPMPPSSQPAKAGFAAQPPGAVLTASRLDLELRLLFSRGTSPLDEDRLAALRIELGQRAWSLTYAIGAPRPADPAWPTVPHPENALEKLRARLVADVDLGLSMVEVPESRYPRPVRNVLLARQATFIGRRLEELLADPAAGSLAEEWALMMEALRRRR